MEMLEYLRTLSVYEIKFMFVWFPLTIMIVLAPVSLYLRKKYYALVETDGLYDKHIFKGQGQALPIIKKLVDYTIISASLIMLFFAIVLVWLL